MTKLRNNYRAYKRRSAANLVTGGAPARDSPATHTVEKQLGREPDLRVDLPLR